MPNHPKTVTLSDFKGLNNVLKPERTPDSYLKEALNVDIDKTGGIHKRKGYALIMEGNVSSLWSDNQRCFAVLSEDLVEIRDDYSTVELLADVGMIKPSFAVVGDEYYFVSNEVTGVIQRDGSVRPFGILGPAHNGQLSHIAGSLPEGTYQVALTYIDQFGRESGTGLSSEIYLPTIGGILLSDIPNSTQLIDYKVRIYVSTQNGEILYRYTEVPAGTTQIPIISGTERGVVPLETFNVFPAPNGHIVKYAHGRLWVAVDNVVWYSDPHSLEWFNLQSNYFIFKDRIKAIMPTQGGLWIASDGLYYLAGKDPAGATLSLKEEVSAVEGTDVQVSGSYIFIENTPIGYKWLVTTNLGIFICFNDGITLNMTEKNFTFPPAERGTAVFVQESGINRYTTTLQKQGKSTNMAVGDQVTTTIIRNGIILED
jgi:hypothetical protein